VSVNDLKKQPPVSAQQSRSYHVASRLACEAISPTSKNYTNSTSKKKHKAKIKSKTYNRRDSQMVTHSSTSRPVQCLCMAERTGCPVLTDLWLYVLNFCKTTNMKILHAASSKVLCDRPEHVHGILLVESLWRW
jgi:ribosomal protein L33